ncbi:MAG: hypothetical protein A2Y66_01805 [Nitrospirae bacterium RBG_13_41_22]|nr:MAG: hypothetical protein A2Y66_01805 [Nitrospirae bacterium RBG_13_41_22]
MTEVKIDPDLILSERGTPFKSEAFARNAIEKKGLDQNKHRVVPYKDEESGDSGFAIQRRPENEKEEKYYWVQFNERQNESEEKDVILGVNGEFLVIERGKKVIIPERYKECADHTVRQVFTQRPNEPRKNVGTVQLYPYASFGEATKQEYLKMKNEGNRLTREYQSKMEQI